MIPYPLERMVDHHKALPPHSDVLVDARPDLASPGSATPAPAPLQPLDFDGTVTLSDATLRAIACESPVPGARLAASWRLLIRGQALPTGAPGEGLRCLTLLNLATQQDLEILEVLLCLDPSAIVRGQAAVLLWRVARDRDRVVDRLVSQVRDERAPEVLVQLLSLVPSLPFGRTQSIARAYLGHPSLDVRRASWSYWLQSGGSMEPSVTAFLWDEPSRELCAACLRRWANDPGHAEMLREVGRRPGAAGAVLEALTLAGRSFRLTEMSALLDDRHLDAALRIARRPFDATDRRILVSLTGLVGLGHDAGPEGADTRPWHDSPRIGWIGEGLWRCLREAYSCCDALALTEEEKNWASVLGKQIAAGEAAAPAEEDEEIDPAYELDEMRQLLDLLTSSPAA